MFELSSLKRFTRAVPLGGPCALQASQYSMSESQKMHGTRSAIVKERKRKRKIAKAEGIPETSSTAALISISSKALQANSNVEPRLCVDVLTADGTRESGTSSRNEMPTRKLDMTAMGAMKGSGREARARNDDRKRRNKKRKKVEHDERIEVDPAPSPLDMDDTRGFGTADHSAEPNDRVDLTAKDLVTESQKETAARKDGIRRKKRKRPDSAGPRAVNVEPNSSPANVEKGPSGEHDQTAEGASSGGKRKKRRKGREPADIEGDLKSAPVDDGGEEYADVDEREAIVLEGKTPRSGESCAREGWGIATVEGESDPRLARTVFVGNVSQKATSRDIKKLFKPFGKIETVRIRGVVPVNPKIPKKTALLTHQLAKFADSFQAYVVFEESEDVARNLEEACQTLNMTVFMERHIRVMPAGHKGRGPRKVSLFLGNLPFDCSEEELITTFTGLAKKIGVEIVNARVNRDKDSGIGRGVGFITFNDSLGVQGCINAMGEVKIRGRVVRMEPASKMKKTNTKTYRRASAGDKKRNTNLYWKGASSKYLSRKRPSKPSEAIR